MCSPASEAHSSGGGSRAEYREKGSCQPCKSHPETSAVESETRPAIYSSAGPPNQPTPCGAELGAWELNWGVWAPQTRGKPHKDFLPLWLQRYLVGPTVFTAKCVRVKALIPGTPLGNWLKNFSSVLLPFLRHHGVLQLQKGPQRGGAGNRNLSPCSGPHMAPGGIGAVGQAPGRAVCKALLSGLPGDTPTWFLRPWSQEEKRRDGMRMSEGMEEEARWLWWGRERESVLQPSRKGHPALGGP